MSGFPVGAQTPEGQHRPPNWPVFSEAVRQNKRIWFVLECTPMVPHLPLNLPISSVFKIKVQLKNISTILTMPKYMVTGFVFYAYIQQMREISR